MLSTSTNTKPKKSSINDNPSSKDKLENEKYMNGLANFIQRCDTPLTIAMQEDWGTGKLPLCNN